MFRKFSGFRRKKSSDDEQLEIQEVDANRRSSSTSVSSISMRTQGQEIASSASPPNNWQWALAESSNAQSSRKNSEVDPIETSTLGLSVVYSPANGHKADIVFVHGLGGTSRNTWSKVKKPELFWPLTFLPLEPDICLARILTFGYNGSISKGDNVKSLLDFAKDLLFDLKYAKDDQGEELDMGDVPLIFVVHSMGGLIVKEAYMQGQHDPEYAAIVKAITAITFLATPHRGTNLAQVLSRILQTTVFTNSKQFISEMGRHSLSLQKLNEQFRHIAPKLDIVSFYETRPTPIGLKGTRVMILEKDSSVLGYPGETSKPLDADHNGVCKYDSPKDPNYVAVKNILKSLVSKIIASKSAKSSVSSPKSMFDLKTVLAITEVPTMDYSFFRDRWTPGTNEWILKDPSFLAWRYAPSETGHHLFWLNGAPAAGKSVMSSFIINGLVEGDARCQYFFIRFGDQKKRTLSLLLRSIAYQIALSSPDFLERVLQLAEEGIQFETADPRVIWERIFRSILFRMEGQREPLYWVIDGLDEADDPRSIVKLLSEISSSLTPIRLLIVGRKSSDMEASFLKVPAGLMVSTISIHSGQDHDLHQYITRELDVPGSPEFKTQVVQRILDGAQSNFLWVRLAVEQMNLCHREAEIEAAFQQLPAGMEALYDRMALCVTEIRSPTYRELASTFLQFSTCALRVLTVAQLSQALGEGAVGMLDLERSIVDLCSGFVVVDNSGNVSMAHQTAREYLLSSKKDRPFSINRNTAHGHLFSSSMRCLMAPGLQGKIVMNQIPEFVDYAATSWAIHLNSAPLDDRSVVQTLKQFLTGRWVLTWIEYLASVGQLQVLIQASKNISKYTAKLKARNTSHTVDHVYSMELELFESWSVDFVKVLGKFGTTLRRNPRAIYTLIAPFCPRNSAIYQHFGKTEARKLQLLGLSAENWDDAVARISFGDGAFASSISVAGAYIFVLTSTSSVLIYDSSTFEQSQASPVTQRERVYMVEVNSTGSLFATYGYRTTKVWETSTGKCKFSIENLESRPRPLVMLFDKKRPLLLVGTDDSKIRSVSLTQPSPIWQLVADLEEPELDGHFLNAANLIALNEDSSLVAVAYRGHPLSAWETDGPVHIGHCWRKREALSRGEVIDAAWLPHSPEVLGVYIEGIVFKWNPYTDETEEVGVGANRISLSKDGRLFATGNGKGTVKVFVTSDFSPLYQLTSSDAIFNVAFSPASHRFYDIRGYYANVWEPNALMSFAGSASGGFSSENESETNSLAHITSSTFCPSIDSITALAALPNGGFYFCGTERGTVQLHHTQRGRLADICTSKGFLSIEQLNCSDDGRYLSFCDSSKKIIIKSIITGSPSASGPTFETKCEIQMQHIVDGPVLHIMMHPTSSRLLVQAASSLHVISMALLEVTHSRGESINAMQKWILHPQDPSLIMGFGPEGIQVLDWDLTERQIYNYNLPIDHSLSGLEITDTDSRRLKVAQVLITRDKKHILVQLSQLGGPGSHGQTLLYFTSSSFPCPISAEVNRMSVPSEVLPSDLTTQVSRPLTFLSRDRLVFLSRTYSICSWQLPRGPVKELFSLPGDWISLDCLALCRIWNTEKAFLCPRNGEVAVAKCVSLM
ncbi:NACHT and WD domain protein [Dactylonectria macrodidyma]|uniref:NACHT and WD domain protein n=1 Tax=Dactylonectria macrodidyma TaxID=307937 RepID=A0A9P9FMA0_9HYPO|nr:NACHT and WD domain protein [Dactylonectria macrodidyma]